MVRTLYFHWWEPGFNPWIRKIPWSRKWHHTPVFLPGKFHRQSSLAGYSPRAAKSQTRLSNWAQQIIIINTHLYTLYSMCVYVCVTMLFLATPCTLWDLSLWDQTNSKFKQAYNCLYTSYMLNSMYQIISSFSYHWVTNKISHTYFLTITDSLLHGLSHIAIVALTPSSHMPWKQYYHIHSLIVL